MATPIILPQQGNSVESCLVTAWKVQVGEAVQAGDVLAEVETDKALFTVESTVDGTLLAQFYGVGDMVPVMTAIAAVGEPGENVDELRPVVAEPVRAPAAQSAATQSAPSRPQPVPRQTSNGGPVLISPRARALAERKGVDISQVGGSGPGGRIIERDIEAALANRPALTRAAAAMQPSRLPEHGTGLGGRVTTYDLRNLPEPEPEEAAIEAPPDEDIAEIVPVRGIRKLIADRMHASLTDMAQLTLNTSADARALLSYRKRLKASDNADLSAVNINDMLLYAVSRTLPDFPALNAVLADEMITRYSAVHLGFAVDTPRGLVVPVIENAHKMRLSALASETKRLAQATLDGKVTPDELTGATFTVTNLGALGIESFTPIINPPQVAILGVGSVNLKPVEIDGEVVHVPHMALSLTIDHRALDGAPAARFLQALRAVLADFDLLLAR